MVLEGQTIAVICVLAALIFVPLLFFTWVTVRLCCDQQLKDLLGQIKSKDEGEGSTDEDGGLKKPPQVLLSFRDVRYAVPIGKNEEKQILKGVNAYFTPGSLTAIMGPSGCGKSTLLDILADQKEFGTISGDIRINGKPRDALFRRATAYVMQFDVLYPHLTPRETLFFVTELRLAGTMSGREKRARVEETLEALDLAHVADTRMGDGESGGGLSGGQKRRVTVAIELVTGPGLILLDEPTSGLDAYGSLKLVTVLRKLADSGRTLACTIHQPRADIFKMFDNLLLMKLGVMMYFGPVENIFPYFENLGVAVDYSVNPADFIVDLTQDKTEEEKEEERRQLERLQQAAEAQALEGGETENVVVPKPAVDLDSLCESYAESDVRKKHMKMLFHITKGTYEDMPRPIEDVYNEEDQAGSRKNKNPKYATLFLKQVFTLARRAILNDIRNSAYMIGNWVVGPIMMLFYGALYSEVPRPSTVSLSMLESGLEQLAACNLNDTSLALYNIGASVSSLTSCGSELNTDQQLSFVRASLIYQLMAAAYFSEGPYVAQVFLDKQMFIREHAARSYSSGAYHFAWYIRMYFAAFCKGLFFVPIAYFAAQLEINAESYFLFAIFFGAMSACGSSVALICASYLPGLVIAQSVYVLVNILAQNLCGYWLVQAYIPPWFIWIYYINFFRYAFEGSVIGQILSSGSANLDVQSARDHAWTFALIAIIFSLGFQLLAFLGTFLAHRTTTTDSAQMLPDEEADWENEEEFCSGRIALSELRSSDAKPEKLQGVHREGLLNYYRQMQMQSARNFNDPAKANAVNTTLANNGGTIQYGAV